MADKKIDRVEFVQNIAHVYWLRNSVELSWCENSVGKLVKNPIGKPARFHRCKLWQDSMLLEAPEKRCERLLFRGNRVAHLNGEVGSQLSFGCLFHEKNVRFVQPNF